jgi:hypothetical protein
MGTLPIVTTGQGGATLYWPPNRSGAAYQYKPRIQVDSHSTQVHSRCIEIDLRGLMEAIVADPLCRAELDVVLAEARLAEVRSKIEGAG